MKGDKTSWTYSKSDKNCLYASPYQIFRKQIQIVRSTGGFCDEKMKKINGVNKKLKRRKGKKEKRRILHQRQVKMALKTYLFLVIASPDMSLFVGEENK